MVQYLKPLGGGGVGSDVLELCHDSRECELNLCSGLYMIRKQSDLCMCII